jgi:WD40 repeat protein
MPETPAMQGTPIKLFLSYARDDDEAFVRQLYDGLTKANFDVWFDRVSMPSRQLTFYQEIRDAIAARDRLVLVVGPKAVESDYVTQEWRSALEMGKCVNPIVRLNGRRHDGGTVDGYDLIPEELKLVHAEDFRDSFRYAEHLANLVRQLSDPAPPLGKLVAVPTLPVHYRAQPDRLRALRDALLVDLQTPVVVTGAAARVGVEGMGGIGKSVLANALARDLEVRRAFPDGVFWVGVGQQPDLVELQRRIAKELGDEALFANWSEGKQKLRDLLAGRAALLILDDVWRSADADAFDVLGPRCKLMLTTRDAGLVSARAGTHYQVQLPTEAEALALLASAARVTVDSLPPQATDILAECGRLPLALALCGGMASKGHLWERILRALREARLELIADRHEIEEQHRSIWRAMEVSVQVLAPDEQRRFAELAVFATDAPIPEAAVLTLWSHTGGLDELAAADLLVTFNERSLLQLDRSAGAVDSVRVRVSLHDLLHDFATRLAVQLFGSMPALHEQVLDAYRAKCSGGAAGGWASGPNDGYFLQHLGHHLLDAGRGEELVELLLDLRWLEAKAPAGLVFDLAEDFSEALRRVGSNHPRRRLLALVEEAIRADIHFIARHAGEYPQALFQCLWNTGWWYDCPEAARYYEAPQGGWAEPPPWKQRGPQKLHSVLEEWRRAKEAATPGFPWLRAHRPPPLHLGTAQRRVMRGHEDKVMSVALSADGTMIVSGSGDKTVRVWDAATGAERLVLRGHEGQVRSVALSADGRTIVSASDGMTIVSASDDQTVRVRVWDAANGAELRVLRGPKGGVTSVALSADGTTIVSGCWDQTVRVWDAASGAQRRVLRGHENWVMSVALSADGTTIVSGSGDKTVRVWDAATGAERLVLRGHESEVTSVAVNADGTTIVSGSEDQTVRVWDAASGAVRRVLHRHDGPVYGVALSADGTTIVSGSLYHKTVVWDAASGEERRVLDGHDGPVYGVALSADGTTIVSGSEDQTVRVWDAAGGADRRVLGGQRSVTSVALSADGTTIVTWPGYQIVRVWDAASGAVRRVLRGHEGWVNCVALSADGTTIVSGSEDQTVRVWDAATGAERLVLRGHEGQVRSVALSADGRTIVSGSKDQTVRVWDAPRRRLLWQWPSRSARRVLRGHEGWVNCVALSADGTTIVSGSGDQTVRVWDAASGAVRRVLRGHEDWVNCVALSADRTTVVSGSDDKTVRVWDVASGACRQVIQGTGDVAAIAAGSSRFPFRALGRGLEAVIEDAATGAPVARFPVPLDDISTFPSGRAWVGTSANHLYIITLEGGEDSSKPKAENGKPDGEESPKSKV